MRKDLVAMFVKNHLLQKYNLTNIQLSTTKSEKNLLGVIFVNFVLIAVEI